MLLDLITAFMDVCAGFRIYHARKLKAEGVTKMI
jgi:hypothetical protein